MAHRIQYSTLEVLNLLDVSNDQDEPFMEGSDEEFEDWLTDEEDETAPPPTGNVTQHTLTSPPQSCKQLIAATNASPPSTNNTHLLTGPSGSNASPSTTAINNTDLLTGPSTVTNQATKFTNTWSSLIQPVQIQAFTGSVGPTFSMPDMPVDVFTHFFTNDLIDKIVVQTNLYASQVMTEDSFSNWEKTTVEELKAYFGFYILMGINHLPSLDDYWKLDSVLHYSPVADKITRQRFREISRYLHFTNNMLLDSEK